MATPISLLSAVTLTGAGLGLMIAYSLLWRRRSRPAFSLGLLLLCASFALGLITLEHQGWIPRRPLVYAIEEFLTVASGALLLSFVYHAIGRRTPLLVWAPVAAFPLLALFERTHSLLEIEHLVGVQIGYFLVACTLYARHRKQYRHFRLDTTVLVVLGSMGAIHAAQMVRMIFDHSPWALDIVPITGTLFFYLLIAQALMHSPLVRALARVPDERQQGVVVRRFDDVQRLLEREKLWRIRGLSLNDLADRARISRSDLSSAVNAALGKSFSQWISEHRVQDACELLTDPLEARYTVEGIGLQCGFGSRAAFYRTFKQVTGHTPSAWRSRHLADVKVSQNTI